MSPPRSKRRRGNDGKFVSKPPPIPSEPKIPPTINVLGTTELLETILLNLPMQDMLLVQRVCRSWHALITSSLRLRRALFMEPVACGAVSYIDWRLDDKDFYSEDRARLDLGEHLRGAERDQMPKRYPAHWGKTREDAGKYRVFVNPLLTKLFPVLSKDGVYWMQELKDLPTPAQLECASWRRMFFTQPPVNFLAVEWDSAHSEAADDDGGGGHPDWTISSLRKGRESKGLRMEELFGQLMGIGRPAWIEGSEMWEAFEGAGDLGRVVVGREQGENMDVEMEGG